MRSKRLREFYLDKVRSNYEYQLLEAAQRKTKDSFPSVTRHGDDDPAKHSND